MHDVAGPQMALCAITPETRADNEALIMKQTIVLHIGMHKTATTSIQNSLAGFTDGTTRYARLGAANHSIPLITALASDPHTHRHFSQRGLNEADVSPLRKAARVRLGRELDSPEPRLILSGEALTDLSPKDMRILARYLGRHADTVHVIAYIREPVGFASSAYQQRIKGGRKNFAVPSPNYRKRFRKVLRVFDGHRVEFVSFEPKTFRNVCIITDFCDRVGVDADQVPKINGNESLSPEAVALLLSLNSSGQTTVGSPVHLRAREELIEALRPAFPGKFAFDAALIRRTVNKADCAWMEEQAGFKLPLPASNRTGIRRKEDLNALLESTRGPLEDLLTTQNVPLPGANAKIQDLMVALYLTFLARQSP